MKTKTSDRKNNKLRFGLANVAAVAAICGSFVFAGVSRSCKPGPEKIITKTKKVCDKKEEPPKKNDNKCELDKGEHDPLSPNWDPKSCGYCGDDIQQDWETEENCRYDFRCENKKKRYWRTPFAVYEPQGDRMVLAVKKVTERCKKGRKKRYTTTRKPYQYTGMKPGMAPIATEPPMAAHTKCERQPSTNIVRSIRRNLSTNLTKIWTKHQDLKDKEATAFVTLRVNPIGTITKVFVKVDKYNISPSSVNLDGLVGKSIGYEPRDACIRVVKKTLRRGNR